MLKLLHELRRKDWCFAGVAVLLIIAQVWMDLLIPDQMARITQLIQTGQATTATLLLPGGKMVLCALASFVFAAAGSIFSAAVAVNFATALRKDLFETIQAFSMAEFEHFSTASLITRTTNDVMQVQMLLVMGLQSIIRAPIMAFWAVAKIADKNSAWTLSVAAAIGILSVLVSVCFLLSLPRFKALQQLTDELNGVTKDCLTSLPGIRAYGAQGLFDQKFDTANQSLTSAHLFTGRVMAVMNPGIQAVMSVLNLVVYLIGALLIQQTNRVNQVLLFSDMIVFSQYSIQIIMSFMMLAMSFTSLPRAVVSARRILQVLDAASDRESTAAEGTFSGSTAGEIEFRNVTFRYPESQSDVLKDLNFHIHPGETVAFIGPTGSGKTSILNLIPRLYEPSGGQVLVGGRDVHHWDPQALRKNMGYAAQKTVLFSGSIRENLQFGTASRPTDQEAVLRSLEIAQAEEFVSALPKRTATKVAQFGRNFSGGEQQRLAIARAIHRNPEILIFDDSFSALDYKTELQLRRELDAAFPHTTKLIVTQRISTVKDIPRIIVVDQGRIAGIGSHRELMDSCPVYRSIASLQQQEEVV